jgi:hypothetical protein
MNVLGPSSDNLTTPHSGFESEPHYALHILTEMGEELGFILSIKAPRTLTIQLPSFVAPKESLHLRDWVTAVPPPDRSSGIQYHTQSDNLLTCARGCETFFDTAVEIAQDIFNRGASGETPKEFQPRPFTVSCPLLRRKDVFVVLEEYPEFRDSLRVSIGAALDTVLDFSCPVFSERFDAERFGDTDALLAHFSVPAGTSFAEPSHNGAELGQ